MENPDHKNTWKGFTKLVFWGTFAVSCNFSNSSFNFTIKFSMIIGSIKEDLSLEKRVSLTPESAKNIISLGLKVCVEKDYALHLGLNDKDYTDVGVIIKKSQNDVLQSCNLLTKVNCPTDSEIEKIKENTILIGMMNPSKNQNLIS